jgi:hypothetical protein
MEGISQGGKGMSQVSGQWRVGDELQRWGGGTGADPRPSKELRCWCVDRWEIKKKL